MSVGILAASLRNDSTTETSGRRFMPSRRVPSLGNLVELERSILGGNRQIEAPLGAGQHLTDTECKGDLLPFQARVRLPDRPVERVRNKRGVRKRSRRIEEIEAVDLAQNPLHRRPGIR